MSSNPNSWTVNNVRRAAVNNDMYYLCLRIVQGDQEVRRAVSLVLDMGLLNKEQLSELEGHLVTWIKRKKDNEAFTAKLKAGGYMK